MQNIMSFGSVEINVYYMIQRTVSIAIEAVQKNIIVFFGGLLTIIAYKVKNFVPITAYGNWGIVYLIFIYECFKKVNTLIVNNFYAVITKDTFYFLLA